MIAYRNSQTGWLITLLLAAGFIYTLSTLSLDAVTTGQYIVLLVLIVAGVLFYKLNVVVERGVIVVSFGQGMISKSIRARDLAGCCVVKVPWYYGFGIRLTPSGWLYNVSGSNAVELTYRSGKKFIIGSNEADVLCETIQDEISKYATPQS